MSRAGGEEQRQTSGTRDFECFTIGPIGDRLAPIGSPERDVYEQAIQIWEQVIQPACDQLNVTPVRADRISRAGEITEQVFRLLRDADVVIADVTGGNPNVMYELGLRHTKNKLTIQLGERGRLPFDINVVRTIRFNRTERGLIEGREALRAALEAGLRGQFDLVTATRVWNEGELPLPSVPGETLPAGEQSADEEPGFLELLAEAEQAMPRLNDSLTDIARIMEGMAVLSQSATDELNESDAAGHGASGRLAITIRFAQSLSGPATELEQAAVDYEGQMMRIDPGVSYLIGRAEEEPELLDQAPEFTSAISNLAQATREGMAGLQTLSDSVGSLEQIARPIRPVARQIRSALRRIREASSVIGAWEDRLKAITQSGPTPG